MCYYIYYILYYINLMGSPSYMRSIVDRNVDMWRIPLLGILLFLMSDRLC